MLNNFIRWIIRYFGYEAEIKKETKVEIGNQIDEVVAWVTTAAGTPIKYKNPELQIVLGTISECLENNAFQISADMVRKIALSHLRNRRDRTILIEFILNAEKVELNDFIAFLDMCRYQLQELINSHDGEPNEEDHRRTIKHILEQREWNFPFFTSDLEGYKPENYE